MDFMLDADRKLSFPVQKNGSCARALTLRTMLRTGQLTCGKVRFSGFNSRNEKVSALSLKNTSRHSALDEMPLTGVYYTVHVRRQKMMSCRHAYDSSYMKSADVC